MTRTPYDPKKPDLHDIEPLDVAGISEAADAWVQSQVQVAGQVEDQLKAVAAIVNEYDALEASFRHERDLTALAVEHYFNIRRGASMHEAIGVNRTRWSGMRKAAEGKRQLRRYADPVKLVELARATYEARMRAHHARLLRDDMVRLLAEEMTNVEIAALIDRNPSQVSHIKYPKVPEPA